RRARDASEARGSDDALDIRGIVTVAVVLVATVIGCALVALGIKALLAHVYGRAPDAPGVLTAPSVQGPPLESTPADALEAYRASKREILHAYRWIDRKAGVVQIPIEQAMRELAARS